MEPLCPDDKASEGVVLWHGASVPVPACKARHGRLSQRPKNSGDSSEAWCVSSPRPSAWVRKDAGRLASPFPWLPTAERSQLGPAAPSQRERLLKFRLLDSLVRERLLRFGAGRELSGERLLKFRLVDRLVRERLLHFGAGRRLAGERLLKFRLVDSLASERLLNLGCFIPGRDRGKRILEEKRQLPPSNAFEARFSTILTDRGVDDAQPRHGSRGDRCGAGLGVPPRDPCGRRGSPHSYGCSSHGRELVPRARG